MMVKKNWPGTVRVSMTWKSGGKTIYDEKAHRDFAKMLEDLIRTSFKAQKIFAEDRDDVSYVDTACTVRLGGPRRIGHTSAMAKVGLKMFENPLFMFPNENMARCAKADGLIDEDATTITFEDILYQPLILNFEPDAVFVDEASHFLTCGKMERLRNICSRFAENAKTKGKPFCLVLLA